MKKKKSKRREDNFSLRNNLRFKKKIKEWFPLLGSLCSICQNTTLEARGMSFITVWLLGNGTFTLAETGLIAQMKLSCLIVFGEGRSIQKWSFRCLSNKKIRVTLNVMALLRERQRVSEWERERADGRLRRWRWAFGGVRLHRVTSNVPTSLVAPHYDCWVKSRLSLLLKITLKKCFCLLCVRYVSSSVKQSYCI